MDHGWILEAVTDAPCPDMTHPFVDSATVKIGQARSARQPVRMGCLNVGGWCLNYSHEGSVR
jgi:hypothetical protein